MKPLSFRDYVLTHSPEDSAAGDFIADSKTLAKKLPDAANWDELEHWLYSQNASTAAIEAAREVWKRFEMLKQPVTIELGHGLTVKELIELLQTENPDAHVAKYHPDGKVTASRVRGYSRVTVRNGTKELPTIMLE